MRERCSAAARHVIGDLAGVREAADADEGEVDAEAVERRDHVEADRRLLGRVDLAAEHVDARAGDAAEQLRVRQARWCRW